MDMKLVILVETIEGGRFRATLPAPFVCTAEAMTREEAIRRLGEKVEARLRSGTDVALLTIPVKKSPWAELAGSIDLNNPIDQEWLEIMKENRRGEDQELNLEEAS